jgi:Zn-dependent peptidase ImmA (M78 family)
MAPAKYVPITGSVLQWAMDEAGVSNADLAGWCGVDASVVESWREGNAQPTKTQFNNLASRLKRSSAFFFLPEPPQRTGVPPAFRQPPGQRGGRREILPAEERAVRTARRIQSVSRWLRLRTSGAEKLLPSLESRVDAENAAVIARDVLNWSTRHQTEADSEFVVLRDLRATMEDAGLLVLHLQMGGDNACRGFSLHDDVAPAIAVNTWYSATARAYSYVHELGHVLRGRDSICAAVSISGEERWCDQFAAAFLMPRQQFLAFAERRFPSGLISNVDDVGVFARYFNVSLRAAAIRLESIGRAAAGLYGEVDRVAEYKRGGGRGRTGATAGVRRVQQFGRAYPSELLEAESSGLLHRQDVLEYLNVKENELPKVRQALTAATVDVQD